MTNRKITHQPISEEVEELVQHHSGDPEAILEILKELDARGHLNRTTITDTARAIGVPAHRVYGMATFYSMLSVEPRKKVIRVCDGPACWLKRASQGYHEKSTVEQWAEAVSDKWTVERSSCLGMCDRAPAVLVGTRQAGPVTPADAGRVCQGWSGTVSDYSVPRAGETRVMLENSWKIDPDDIHTALAHGAYEGLKAALKMTPEEVIAVVESSGLQGRGGAGFPVGRKWKFVAAAESHPKTMVCNADESEPLVFKDRVLIHTNPQQLIEGMAIGGYACGADQGWIYIRGEYATQAEVLERAIAQAEEEGFLGENILGSDFSFRIHVHRGAGAYICGEETALIESLEGKTGEPRLRPPYPPTYGFRGTPTAVNNVESFSAVPAILRNGARFWTRFGAIPGTKLYMILGHVRKPGLFEAPFGLTLRQIIDKFGGGMLPGSKFKFALTGGAAGTIVGKDKLDIPLDYASHQQGIGLGAGAFLIADQRISVVSFLRELLHFFASESCGKCTPCRVGTARAHQILARMAAGEGEPGDVAELTALAENMQLASFCGLGQSVPIPMNSAMKNFAAEFDAAGK